jgi:ketosteroid isomerase-like protein
MHDNTKLVERLYDALNRHDSEAMANCYHPKARFRDIAFDLKGRDQIGTMWGMICKGDIQARFEVVRADEASGVAKLVDEYTFTDTGRRVRNSIESSFRFRDGLIVEHRDFCDERAWAAQAIGGPIGFLAGRLRFLRAWKANAKLRRFREASAQGEARGGVLTR